LPRGQHVVVARRHGYEALAQAIRVEGPVTEIALHLSEDPLALALDRAVAPGMREEAVAALVEALLTYGDVDEVLLVATTSRRGAPALLAQRCDGASRCSAVVEIGYARPGLGAAMRQAWATLARGELRYAPSLPSDSRVLPTRLVGGDSRCRVCRSPWLWAGVGTALAVTSAVLVIALGQSDPPPVVTIDPDTFAR
jgi:hypothetical protein